MKKILLTLAALSVITPFFVSADDGPATCFRGPEGNEIPTCKQIEKRDIYSLDASLQGKYIMGQHNAFSTFEPDGSSVYSEELNFATSSGPLIYEDSALNKGVNVFVMDKEFILAWLKNIYKKNNVKTDNYLDSIVDIISKKETILFDSNGGPFFYPKNYHIPPEATAPILGTIKLDARGRHNIYTDEEKVGRYILGPNIGLKEYAYVKVDKGEVEKIEKDAGVLMEVCGHWGMATCFSVPLTSPIKEQNNYWAFEKLNGEIILKWQKTDFILDDGTIKSSKISNKEEVSSSTVNTEQKNVLDVSQVKNNNKGFFARILEWVFSWFK